MEYRSAADVIPCNVPGLSKIQVPFFTWDEPHPHVPEIDESYTYRPNLIHLLFSLVSGVPCWIHGHSGTGKTSLVEQVCARLGWPVRVVNLDSEIGRMDLVGRDVITKDAAGHTISKFEEGILPQAISSPCVLILDECDYGRPDVMYVLQRALEGRGFLLAEDGGRYIHQHPMHRVVATGNTKGAGDETGLYPGARVQSAAFLNRFKAWIKVDYMTYEEEIELLKRRVPGLPDPVLQKLGSYINEHRVAFRNAEIMQPVSPRNIETIGKAYHFMSSIASGETGALWEAMKMSLFDAANDQDSSVMTGIANRVVLEA
jgi:cobaltochelatase CobS